MQRTQLTTALIASACAIACAQPFQDRSSTALPTEMLQGRSMDAEFVDLNADGKLDLIVAAEFGQNVVLLAGESGFAESRNAIPRGRIHDSEDIATGDFDGDGRTDIVFVAEDDQTNELYLQTEPGVFRDASDTLPGPGHVTNAVLAIDIDNDADLDLLLGNQGQNIAWINDGKGGFTPDVTGRLPQDTRTTQDIEAGDIDGDGDTDLIIANEDGNRVLFNDGSGRFTDETGTSLLDLPDIETREADLADLDNDGDLDIVFANVGWNPAKDARNTVLLNNGAGVFADHTPSTPANNGITLDADCIDIDRDGDIDILLGNTQMAPPLQVWLNDGSAGFTDATAAWMSQLQLTHTIDLEVIDLDHDGSYEIYLANHISADKLLRLASDHPQDRGED
jgi:hypothetical protein